VEANRFQNSVQFQLPEAVGIEVITLPVMRSLLREPDASRNLQLLGLGGCERLRQVLQVPRAQSLAAVAREVADVAEATNAVYLALRDACQKSGGRGLCFAPDIREYHNRQHNGSCYREEQSAMHQKAKTDIM